MKKKLIKKMSIALGVTMMVSCFVPVSSGMTASPVAKAATKTIKMNEGEWNSLSYDSPKAGAKYSVVSSNKKAIDFGNSASISKDGSGITIELKSSKAGSSVVKLKETYGGTTKTVATYKVKVNKSKDSNSSATFDKYRFPERDVVEETQNTEIITPDINNVEIEDDYEDKEISKENFIQLEKGDYMNLNRVVYKSSNDVKVKFIVENKDIVSVNGDIITAKNVGETKLKLSCGNSKDEIVVVVVEKTSNSKVVNARKVAKEVDAFCRKKVTKANLMSMWNKYLILQKKSQKIYGYDKKSNTYLELGKYNLNDMYNKIREVSLKQVVALDSAYGVSIESIKLPSSAGKTINVTFDKPISKYDLLRSNMAYGKKYSAKGSFEYFVLGYSGYKGKLKVGDRSATLKAVSEESYKELKGDNMYCIWNTKGEIKVDNIKVK